jgi:hypothetical protein
MLIFFQQKLEDFVGPVGLVALDSPYGPTSCTFLQSIGFSSCGKDALHQIWMIESKFGKKILKKDFMMLKISVMLE